MSFSIIAPFVICYVRDVHFDSRHHTGSPDQEIR